VVGNPFLESGAGLVAEDVSADFGHNPPHGTGPIFRLKRAPFQQKDFIIHELLCCTDIRSFLSTGDYGSARSDESVLNRLYKSLSDQRFSQTIHIVFDSVLMGIKNSITLFL
jgi:hypothetical protein